MKSLIKVRLKNGDHLDIIKLFKDVCAETLIKHDNFEGSITSYEKIQLLSPVYEGDYIEIEGKVEEFNSTDRIISIVATKIISNKDNKPDYLYNPIVVCTGLVRCIASEN